MNSPKVRLQILAEPGTQSLCSILGLLALYDPQIIGGAIDTKTPAAMTIELELSFQEPARTSLVLARLNNLVSVRDARMVNETYREELKAPA